MANFENKEKEAALFAPRERRNENSADFEGRMLINGELHWVNMWRNKTRNGDEYFKVKLKPAQARAEQISNEAGFGKSQPRQPSYADQSGSFDRNTGEVFERGRTPDLDDEIPFAAEFR